MFTQINSCSQGASAASSLDQMVWSPYFTSQHGRKRPLEETGTVNDLVLLPTSVLPDRLRSLFSFKYFNAMQSKSFDTLFASDESVVLSAPTSSGKTVCFELAVARLLTSPPTVSRGQLKVHPKSMAMLILRSSISDRRNRFARNVPKTGRENLLALTCSVSTSTIFVSSPGGELTGDTDSPDTDILRDHDVIVTTPEKWDAVTRRRKDLAKFMELVRLLLVL